MAARAERATEAAQLRAAGLKYIEIAELMGISKTYACALVRDPTGDLDRQRKKTYGRPCVDCGQITNGSDGRMGAGIRCNDCNHRERHWQAVKRIIAGIRRFRERYGRLPAAADFNPANARTRGDDWRAERFYKDGDYPFSSEVCQVFGSWNAAITAAGFEPFPLGCYERLPGRQGTGDPVGAHLADERAANV